MNEFDVGRLPALLNADYDRIALARRRQSAFFRGEKPDAWPILFHAPLTPEQEEIPDANYEEAFYSQEKMLCSQVRLACETANARSDAVPSIRANLGTGVTLSCIGLKQLVFPDKMPWLRAHLTKEQAVKLEPDDIKVQGDFQRGLDYMRYFRTIMGASMPVYCFDTQGPFDLAHLLIGDDLFYALYDDPAYVHNVLEICLEIDIKTYTWMKEINGEAENTHYHANSLYAENISIRCCEDTTVVVSDDQMEKFALPYTQRLAQYFGAAWVHYCGRNDHLTEALCHMPEIRAVNFGFIPGHEQIQPFDKIMSMCREHDTIYFGEWPRYEGETGRDYLKRLHYWTSQGVFLAAGNPALEEPDGFASVDEALNYWYNL